MISEIISHLIHVMIYSVISVNCLPARYCLSPLNRTDCGHPPTPMFSYYKPSSRCEIEIWRGCPSYNRFESEPSCSHFCVGKLRFREIEYNEIRDDDESCEENLNKDDCGSKLSSVYTFNKKTDSCEKVEWRGCRSSNKFSSEDTCIETCMPHLNITIWKAKLDKLTQKEIEEMNTIIDGLLEPKHKLSHSKKKPEPEPNKMETISKDMSKIITTSIPEIVSTNASIIASTITPEGGSTVVPEQGTTVIVVPTEKTTVVPEQLSHSKKKPEPEPNKMETISKDLSKIITTSIPEIVSTNAPIISSTTTPEGGSTVVPEQGTTVIVVPTEETTVVPEQVSSDETASPDPVELPEETISI